MKRAFIDCTPELISSLLHLQDGIEVIHSETIHTSGGVIRFHLRGEGLPTCAECQQGNLPHQIIDMRRIQVP
jgi:hypothetical protein